MSLEVFSSDFACASNLVAFPEIQGEIAHLDLFEFSSNRVQKTILAIGYSHQNTPLKPESARQLGHLLLSLQRLIRLSSAVKSLACRRSFFWDAANAVALRKSMGPEPSSVRQSPSPHLSCF